MRVDFCILMSLSSTMVENWAEKVKNSIEVIVNNVTDANQGLDIRFGAVVVQSDN